MKDQLLSIPIESDDDELLEAISKVHINNLLEEEVNHIRRRFS